MTSIAEPTIATTGTGARYEPGGAAANRVRA